MEKENKVTLYERSSDLKICFSIFERAMELAFNHDLAYEVAYKKAYMEAC